MYKVFVVAMQASVDRLGMFLDNSTVDSLDELRNCTALSEVCVGCVVICLTCFCLL